MTLDKVKHILKSILRKREEKREVLIDFHKGLILLLMVITHTIALTYNFQYNDGLVFYIGLIGGIASFTSFLFLSGATSYLSFIKEREETAQGILKIFDKEIKIFSLYYILAFVALVVINKASFNNPVEWMTNIKLVLTLTILPEFTEFLPALAIFSLSLIFFKKFYHYLSDKILLSIVIGIGIYFIGTLLLQLNFESNSLTALQSLLVGHTTNTLRVHSFPIFQYFIIFLFGINIGRFLYENSSSKTRFIFFLKVLAVTLPVTIVLTGIYFITKNSLFYPLPVEGRFPPSLSFISLSLSIAIILLGILDYIIQYIPTVVSKFLIYLSKNALGILLTHLLILFGLKDFYDITKGSFITQPTDFQGILIIFIFVIILSCLLVNFMNFIHIKLIHNGEYRKIFRYILKPVHLYKIVIVLIIIIGAYMFFTNEFLNSVVKQKTPEEILTLKSDWWDDAYKVKRGIAVKNATQTDYTAHQWIKFSFDHKRVVDNNNAYSKGGDDLRVIYFDSVKGKFIQIPFIIDNPYSTNTTVNFQLQDNTIAGESNDNYFLYYGNASNITYPKSNAEEKNVIENSIFLTAESFHSITASVDDLWYIKDPQTKKLNKQLVFNLNLNNISVGSNSNVTYSIEKAQLNGVMNKEKDAYRARINLDNLNPDVYTIQANVIENNDSQKVIHSYKVPFKVTYPLYITWSLDWEGWDVSDANLAELNTIANTYHIPVTQLFNPRIYVKNQSSNEKITPERAQYLTQWLLNRKSLYGDEIGMHVHMYTDMLSEIGVVGGTGEGAYGEAKASDFSKEQLENIFNWSLLKFQENGLPVPVTFRSGGWFSAPQVLQALQNTGFLIDTSGRTPGTINLNNPASAPLPWTLQATTLPYKPSINNINTWEGERLNLWEFPDNGADSYWYKTQTLLDRFKANNADPRGILTHPQVLTYLSHPHWLTTVDKPKLNALFQYIDNYLYSKDKGPAVYTTLQNAYNAWDKINDVNGN